MKKSLRRIFAALAVIIVLTGIFFTGRYIITQPWKTESEKAEAAEQLVSQWKENHELVIIDNLHRVDAATGVVYFIKYASTSSPTAVLNADGTPVVYEGNLEEMLTNKALEVPKEKIKDTCWMIVMIPVLLLLLVGIILLFSL